MCGKLKRKSLCAHCNDAALRKIITGHLIDGRAGPRFSRQALGHSNCKRFIKQNDHRTGV